MTCLVGDCSKEVVTRGYCESHYRRFLKYGDPLGGGTFWGEARRYYEDVVLKYDGNECLIWPYSRNQFGYPRVSYGGRMRYVSQLVCEARNGPAPSAKHEGAHSCGNGHLACVAGRHLSWKTRAGNSADKITHGTDARGSKHGAAKLTDDQVQQIRSLRGKITRREIADRFGVSLGCVKDILGGRRWAHLSREHLAASEVDWLMTGGLAL